MGSFCLGAVAVLATFYTALIYENTALALLGFAEMLLVASAFFYLLVYRRNLSASVRIPIAVADKGTRVLVQMTVKNQNLLPCMKLRCRLRWTNTFTGESVSRWTTCMAARGKQLYELHFLPEAVGSYTLELEKIRICDLTGLLFLTKRIRRSAGVQVLPEMQAVALRVSERVRRFYGESDQYDDLRAGEDHSQIFDVRAFRAGDKVQQIHWKLSAKSDELLVREDSQPLACAVVLLLEPGRPKGKRRVRERFAQAYAGVAASLVFSMADASCPHYVAWYSGSRRDVVRLRVDDEESLYLFLSCFMEDCSPAPLPLRSLYDEKYRSEPYICRLELVALSLVQNGQELAHFSGKDWQRELAGLELLL